jgi:hypothetical protein
MDLARYDFDRQRGFLPDPDPLVTLPDAFAAWEELGRDLPKLLVSDWGGGKSVPARLPASLAQPWYAVAQKLGRPPGTPNTLVSKWFLPNKGTLPNPFVIERHGMTTADLMEVAPNGCLYDSG